MPLNPTNQPTILLTSYKYIVGQTGLSNVGMATGVCRRKTLNSNQTWRGMSSARSRHTTK